jgi:threonine synthase
MVHYIWIYLRVIEQNSQNLQMGDEIDFIIPTGAMGNIVGGYLAKCMKLPVRRFVAAVNTNDIVYRAVSTGRFYKAPTMYKTLSDAINIQIPYNFERLLYYLTNENSILVQQWMTTLEATDKIDLDTTWHTKLQNEFASASINDNELCNVIQYIQEQYNYLPDPHTAVAFGAAIKLGYITPALSSLSSSSSIVLDGVSSEFDPSSVGGTVIVATASPCKFQESMTEAIGTEVWDKYFTSNNYPSGAKDILSRPEIPPTHYAKYGSTLEESQIEWEQLSCDIIQTKLSTSTT